MTRDVFICHASEDKVSVVRPLVACLEARNISYWMDELEISLGESITEKVNEGLKISSFVVVIISRAFMAKNWPKRELWSVLNLEAKSAKTIVLPVIVGTSHEAAAILEEFPLLNDKLFLSWNGDANKAADAIQNVIMKIQGETSPGKVDMLTCGQCASPFQHGVHVCLGCQGKIIYGLTQQEKLEIRKNTAGMLGALMVIIMIFIPNLLGLWLDLKIPIMWGMGIWFVPVAILIVFAGAFYREAKLASSKADLIRTFR